MVVQYGNGLARRSGNTAQNPTAIECRANMKIVLVAAWARADKTHS
ncbi:Unknown protein sequence [Pseudomonas syringae pv. cilantro]|uniref:Uncharacterized protein n=1 Tax=Pseudomonas syringae pv. cilantro TaxID=81035 RepID=A0A0N0GCY9_PSESX|nr:Unknown protein sequence [Pseudomonas syringae pv. cilantro]